MSSQHARTAARFIATIAIGLVASAASAQFTVTNLHPAGATESSAVSISGGQQVGYAIIGGARRASLWSGSAASHAVLSGGALSNSDSYGVSLGQQVGYAGSFSTYYAALWNGDSATYVNLHPGGSYSVAYATDGHQQVGLVQFGVNSVASIWTGSAASWLNVHPASVATSSYLAGTDGTRQVGQVRLLDGFLHASMWTGTAASWVDLNPSVASESQCNAISGGQQVGFVRRSDSDINEGLRASLWSGTAASWVDLQPSLSQDGSASEALAVFAGQQVGITLVGGFYHASLWNGTAASWMDLHTYLPAEFITSSARGIWSDGGVTYIVGDGYNVNTSRYEALLWASLCPADFDQSGFVDTDDYDAFVHAFEAGTQDADFDGSGFVDTDDFDAFVHAFESGC